MIRTTIPANELLKKTHAVGQYYGFVPFFSIAAATRGQKHENAKHILDTSNNFALDPTAQIIARFLKQCRGTNAEPNIRQPLFVWHTNITPGRPAPKKVIIQFHAIGSNRAIADTVVIRALSALIQDLHNEEPVLRINSMGDKETRARYARELGNFFKKRATTLPEECIDRAKNDALEAAELTIARNCANDLPASTDQLSDASRKRFEDLLELLESTETSYELARDLISRGNSWSETCFEFTLGGKRVAWGSRYSELARNFFPEAMPSTGGVFQIMSEGPIVTKPSTPRTRFSFVHIGDEAKRISIRLAEEFKKIHLPLTQDIGVESLTEQLILAEKRKPTYVILMGRKEALEGSAILRNRQTQEETVLPILGLAERLKTIV